MFTHENTDNQFTSEELDRMKTALDILTCEYWGVVSDDEMEQITKAASDTVLNNIQANGNPVGQLVGDGREYGYNKAEDSIIYRDDFDEPWRETGIRSPEVHVDGLPEVDIEE